MFELIIAKEWDNLTWRLIVWASVILACWIGMAVACFADMWSGVSTARFIGEKVHSHRLRETFQKIKDYSGVLLPFMFVDLIGGLFSFYFLPFCDMAIGICSIFIESSSIFENKKRKRSHAAMIPEMAKEIVKCAREKDAEALIETIQNIAKKQNITKQDNGYE